MPKKMFTVLENNPEVMNHLARALGMDDKLSFYDIYSLTDPDLLAFIPRPVYALLVIIPLTKLERPKMQIRVTTRARAMMSPSSGSSRRLAMLAGALGWCIAF
jgi:cobalamin biosynthesis protein CobD/CbiB